ncbi:MAG: AraC family transcriptional regulator [Defluviitaleaceae bacterium]|nr:AraC family transcriptional regulator [Defluviitaleaceae bacterium]
MNHTQTLQMTLNYIDDNIKSELTAAMIAEQSGYSPYHFSRVFTRTIGTSVMSYVTWRRLQYALYDLSRGTKVIDVAMEYGFETHAGFTKAFVHWFGFPPSLCRLRLTVTPPMKPIVGMLTNKFLGGNAMHPHIMELTPFAAVGYPSRHKSENMKEKINPATFYDSEDMDYVAILTKLHDTFTKSKHFEICMCYDINESTGEFTYIMGRGIDIPEDLAFIEPDMTKVDIAGGLYAIFSTPPVDGALWLQAYQDTFNEIFLHWLPQSEFEYDDTRRDFSYHDYREHGWYFGGKEQVDICIPIRQREEEMRKSQLRAGQ